MVARMTIAQRVEKAYAFLEQSEEELRAGDEFQASEKLWGAATHALRAVIMSEGGSPGKSRKLREVAMRLADERSDPLIREGFQAAEMFHANFYNGFMDYEDIASRMAVVHEFVRRILNDTPPRPYEPTPPRLPEPTPQSEVR